jgi:tripartite-type tricarboxylate transporter receptor subunit TctC
MMAQFPFVLIMSNDFPAKSVKELIAMAKDKPGTINFGSTGNGSGQHLSGELFKLMTRTDMVHVPGLYRRDLGRTPVFFDNLSSGLGKIKGGTVRALAVTGTERAPLLPDVPTVAEAGVPGYQNYVWFGLWAPKKTPPEVVQKLHQEVVKAVSTASVQEQIARDAGVPMLTPLAEITSLMKADIAKSADVIKRANIEVQ